MKTAEEYRREMESYFGTAREDDGLTAAQTSPILKPDSAKAHLGAGKEHEGHNEESGDESLQIAPPSGQIRPALRLHDYERNPQKRAIVEGKLKEQGGLCAWSKLGGSVCGGVYFELDHIDGSPKNGDWGNLQLLCKSHHVIKSNQDRAKARRSKPVSVKERASTPDLASRSVWTSKEGQKAEWSRPEFDKWIANPQTWIDLGRKTGYPDLKIGEQAYLKDLLDFGADSINDPDFPEGISQETLRRYVNARRFSTLRLGKIGHRTGVKYVGETKTIEEEITR